MLCKMESAAPLPPQGSLPSALVSSKGRVTVAILGKIKVSRYESIGSLECSRVEVHVTRNDTVGILFFDQLDLERLFWCNVFFLKSTAFRGTAVVFGSMAITRTPPVLPNG